MLSYVSRLLAPTTTPPYPPPPHRPDFPGTLLLLLKYMSQDTLLSIKHIRRRGDDDIMHGLLDGCLQPANGPGEMSRRCLNKLDIRLRVSSEKSSSPAVRSHTRLKPEPIRHPPDGSPSLTLMSTLIKYRYVSMKYVYAFSRQRPAAQLYCL